ncbi:MAG: MarR family transcriptional regulator [gamma proteobacterium symbiont of Ctena orbiculata]|uniref:MarR family transcriptional regulator n=1 Tax=Candidatus Thiodiazotropha taylori TaxID=2792791 RepID=A0A944M554_9GAMM|nr:MarR family transcriptional regulator [Candidatus Thiodiazotropha taylori]MBV2137629.1 MarR family transcriptional regulator [Candidatus Thiodiazotropha taylori]PVV06802.1 MAG: MarR family transcriptional regulator [gamma proteobacterium symbiont of Ctena orbiculata]PVV06814.1 MAG: MarR family transcriptional regulator [gamma proteobacterium symbiont of Ctena orbiculata]PVV23609.1 MAG: MarR family transcriptional regulator [gamma proteobacterium symbiont of Ctena orbiculata]
MSKHDDIGDQVIVALRRVIRAVDLHSRTLVESHGLTGPQALILKALQNGSLPAGELATQVSLSQGTVTDILNRLEKRGLIRRNRDTEDRRRVLVEATDAALTLLAQSPPLLQESFAERFSNLQDWEQTQLLASLQRIAAMMDAEDIDAAPVLSSGSVRATTQAVEEVLEPEPTEEEQVPVESSKEAKVSSVT